MYKDNPRLTLKFIPDIYDSILHSVQFDDTRLVFETTPRVNASIDLFNDINMHYEQEAFVPAQKNFKLKADQIKQLLENRGGCFATDKITVDGLPVGYMYREEPDNDVDSGWRFLAGSESEDYMDNAENHGVYNVNTIANYDPSIIPLVDSPIGSAFERDAAGKWVRIEAS